MVYLKNTPSYSLQGSVKSLNFFLHGDLNADSDCAFLPHPINIGEPLVPSPDSSGGFWVEKDEKRCLNNEHI